MIDIVVGGQYGSEGKGKVAHILARESQHKCAARVGGPNSGHTIEGHILRHLPATALVPNGICIIGAGSYIDIDILDMEIGEFSPSNLLIDSKAVVITRREHINLAERVGSTLSGTGTGVYDRILRGDTSFIGSHGKYKKYAVPTEEIHKTIANGCIIEGTQGFGLSVIHTSCYPYATSRDTTASGFASELGVSPFDVSRIYMVIRSFPIRVSGNSGPLLHETSWKELNIEEERTSVTNKVRRVGYFDFKLVKGAIRANKPTYIVLNHMDYIDVSGREAFISDIEEKICSPIHYIGLDKTSIIRRCE